MLGEQADRIRAGGVDPSEWNFLKITTLGKKAALSPLLVGGEDPFHESKIYTCCEKVMEYYCRTEAEKGLQLIFLDFGLELYDVIKEELIEQGMAPEEIAFISDAQNDKQKAVLFARCRSGEVRLLIGSTQKMGAGTNIQDRLCAIHHLDAPWRPADLEQRDGRGLRRGNRFKEVGILVYVTDSTFDSYLYQILESKQRFIGQVMTGKSAVRNCDDIDDTALEYGEIKMLTCGDPRIKEKFELDNLVQQLKMEQSAWQQEQLQMNKLIQQLPEDLQDFQQRLARVQVDLKQETEYTDAPFAVTVNGKIYDDRAKAGEALRQYALQVQIGKTAEIASFHGFTVSAYRADLSEDIDIIVMGEHQARFPLGESAVGSIQRLENLTARFADEEKRLQLRIADTEKALAEAEGQLGKPFPKAELLEQAIERQTRLGLELSERPQPTETLEDEICPVPVRRR